MKIVRLKTFLFAIALTVAINLFGQPSGMALIPAGSFTMGNCMDTNEGSANELPLHPVYVSAFYMDKNHVTKALWDSVYQWATNHSFSFDNLGSGKAANHPVQTISWYDAVKWCNARSEKEGLTPCYYTDAAQTVAYRSGQINLANTCVNWNASGYRLPTEAEWEKAARGGASGHRFPWSNTDTISFSQANYYSDNFSYDISPTRGYDPTFNDGIDPYTSPVGYFAANRYGLYDMAGNVWQWCWDRYDAAYYSSSPGSDPHGPSLGTYREVRGGSWFSSSNHDRTAYRINTDYISQYLPTYCDSHRGFRCVSLGDIGPAPTPPTVVQTNRTPSSTELGTRTNGSFKVFTNGAFASGVALDPSKKTIVLTHGWNSSSTDWPASMANQLVTGGISANIVAWDWRDDAKFDCSTTLSKTPWQGFLLGSNLLQNLGGGYSQPIHFIGHSFGTLVNAAAANYLHGEAPNNNPPQHLSPSRTQMTLLDEAEIANVLGKPKVVNPTTANLGWIKPLPNSFARSDNYVSAVGELHDNAVNIIVTENSPGIFYSSFTGLWNALVVYHSEPCGWYGDTILNPTGSVMGNIWSFERTNSFATPAVGTCFVQHGNGLALDQISRYAADDFRAKEFGALVEEIVGYYTLKQINAVIHVVGDVTGNVITAALTDSGPAYQTTPATIGISTYAPVTPDFWSPQLILQNHPFVPPAPMIASKGNTPKGPLSKSSNSPAYAWVPMTIPTDATAMSFDFMIQGNGASDSFEAALNGTNVFSLATSLIQTNVTMNSGLIDVSPYAGQNVELFLGIVGDASTNSILTVSGIRLYSIASPLLQAQVSGNNCVLSWPLSAADYVLQTSTNLADTNSWTAVPNVPAIVNLQNEVTNSASGVARFYRLKK